MKMENTNKEQNKVLLLLLEQLKDVNFKLSRFLRLIPEESIKEYKNLEEVDRAYQNALKLHANE